MAGDGLVTVSERKSTISDVIWAETRDSTLVTPPESGILRAAVSYRAAQRSIMKLQYLWILAIVVGALVSGCGPTEYVVTGTDRAAGADGLITLEDIEGGNHLVNLEIQHLPPPDRLGSGYNTYVVWFYGNGDPRVASVLDYDAEDRSGRATATTPDGAFEIVVTAENTRSPNSPSDVVVARKRVGGDDE
jgi:hypothetical protein